MDYQKNKQHSHGGIPSDHTLCDPSLSNSLKNKLVGRITRHQRLPTFWTEYLNSKSELARVPTAQRAARYQGTRTTWPVVDAEQALVFDHHTGYCDRTMPPRATMDAIAH